MKLYFSQIWFLLGNDQAKLPLLIAIFIALSMLDLIGLGLVIPFVSMVSNDENVMLASQLIFDYAGLRMADGDVVRLMAILLVAVFLVKTIVILHINRMIIYFSNNQMVRIKTNLMRSFQNICYEDYLSINKANYINSMQVLSTQYANSVVMPALRIVSEGIVAVTIILFLAWISIEALLMVVSIFAIFIYFYDSRFKSKLKLYGKNANRANSRIVKAVNEGIDGLKELRILEKSGYFYDEVERSSMELAINSRKSQLITIMPRYLIEFLLVLFLVSFVMLTVSSGQGIDELVPIFAAFGVAAIRLLPIMNNIISSLSVLRIGRHCVSQLYHDVSESKSIDMGVSFDDELCLKKDFCSIELNNVSFRYKERGCDVIRNVTLKITHGEAVGIIGASGSGKTTLLDIILGHLTVQQGEILYNGKDLYKEMKQWHKHIAYLPQQVFIVDDTLRKNIALGQKDHEIDDDGISDAINKSRLSEMVDEMPQGIDTLLGESGMRISGGQRQRIALARAFYYNRDVIVMDEATSALDAETEKEVVEEIRMIKGQVTTIVVAHRMSTLKYCDRIYKIENGTIVSYVESV